jgi:hypothetical protein
LRSGSRSRFARGLLGVAAQQRAPDRAHAQEVQLGLREAPGLLQTSAVARHPGEGERKALCFGRSFGILENSN